MADAEPRPRTALRWLPVAAWAALLRWLGSSPPDALPARDWVAWLPSWDKFAHAGLYGVLGLLAAWAAAPRRATMAALLGLFAGAAWGGLDEWLQARAPGRTPDAFDLVADALGAAAGGWLMHRLAARRAAADRSVDPPRPGTVH